MDQIKMFIKSQARITNLPYLEHYPFSPVDLPDAIKTHAFGNADLPPDVEISELGNILMNHKMRGRAMSKKDLAWIEQVPDHWKKVVKDAVLKSRDSSPPSSMHKGPSKDSLPSVNDEPEPYARQPLPSRDTLRLSISRQHQLPVQPQAQNHKHRDASYMSK